jgi:hypothetical protein
MLTFVRYGFGKVREDSDIINAAAAGDGKARRYNSLLLGGPADDRDQTNVPKRPQKRTSRKQLFPAGNWQALSPREIITIMAEEPKS